MFEVKKEIPVKTARTRMALRETSSPTSKSTRLTGNCLACFGLQECSFSRELQQIDRSKAIKMRGGRSGTSDFIGCDTLNNYTNGSVRRQWIILYDASTLFMVMQSAPKDFNDDEIWNSFTSSFKIKDKAKTCWLPEGCSK